jgi:hypothetical protein
LVFPIVIVVVVVDDVLGGINLPCGYDYIYIVFLTG